MSDNNNSQMNRENYNSYISKYILNNTQEIKTDVTDDDENQATLTSQNSCDNSQITVRQVVKKIAESVKKYESTDSQIKLNKPNVKWKNVKKTNNDFISFSQIQIETNEEFNSSMFNNSFELDDNHSNNFKIDSQWSCDTQLATLVDNADAIVNLLDAKEMTQCFTTQNNHKMEENKQREINATPVDNVENVFKVPQLPRCKVSKSQIIESSNSQNEPLLFTQFKTASQKDISISDTALQKARNIFHDLDETPDVSYKSNSMDISLEVCDEPLDFRETDCIDDNRNELIEKGSDKTDKTQDSSSYLDSKMIRLKDLDCVDDENKSNQLELATPSSNKVVDLDQWENFFNNTMNSSESLTGDGVDSDSDDDLVPSPIIVSQSIKYKKDGIKCKRKILGLSDENLKESKLECCETKENKSDYETAKNESSNDVAEESVRPNSDKFKDTTSHMNNFNMDSKNFKSLRNLPVKKSLISECCGGFRTASDKEIVVSEEALSKVKGIFNDLGLEDSQTIHSSKSNKNVKDHQSLSMVKMPEISENSEMEIIKYDDENMKLPVFTTASNKNIAVSETALARAKSIFKDFDQDDKVASVATSSHVVEKSASLSPVLALESDCVGFKTASNKQISVSQESLSIAESMFKDIDCTESRHSLGSADGFVTASNKEIFISEEAKKKASVLFEDIDMEAEFKSDFIPDEVENAAVDDAYQTSSTSNGIPAFKTASNKDINVSKEALMKAKCLFDGLESEFKDEWKPELDIAHGSKDKIIPGFSTASNKQICISDKALTKARLLFQDIENYPIDKDATNLLNQCLSTKNDLEKSPPQLESSSNDYNLKKSVSFDDTCDRKFIGFTTAGNKKIKISDEALEKAKMLFQDIEQDRDDFAKIADSKQSSKFSGFATASNKEIKISNEALLKAKSLFNDIDTEMTMDLDEASNEIPSYNAPSNNFVGFTTANNKKIKISEDALVKAKLMFQDIEQETDCSTVKKDVKTVKPLSELHLAKVINENIDYGADLMQETKDTDEKFVGFATASNKKIKISEAALSKAKMLFTDIDESVSTIDNNESAGEISKLDDAKDITNVGFATASNKKISISEEAILKAKNIFSDLDFKQDQIDCRNAGFMTASNKEIAVSEKALTRARAMFVDLDNNQLENDEDVEKSVNSSDRYNVVKETTDEDMHDRKTIDVVKPFMGFSTANNKEIPVSKEALDKVQNLFDKFDANSTSKDSAGEQSFVHENLTQEITESTNALLNDEDSFGAQLDDDPPPSPILPTRIKRSKKVFKAPCKNTVTALIERKIDVESIEINENIIPVCDVNLGNLFDEKLHRDKTKIQLKDLKLDQNYNSDDGCNITPDNFHEFIFKNERVDVSAKNIGPEVSVAKIIEIFLDNSNVNRKLIPDNWILNHLKWIMWKLSSYERCFGLQFERVLNLSNVLKQLKYRYDKELYKAERPLLRKILECDDVAGRKMVLCVSRVIKLNTDEKSDSSNNSRYELEVTDGWYSVLATIDNLLTSVIDRGRLTVGTKIITCGAELHNCGQGKSPLEDISDVRLRLHGNSTRIAPWYAKLGACNSPGLLRVSIDSLRARAGPVPVLCFLPLVIYPQLFVEKLPTGDTITRSEKLEQVYLSSIEGDIQANMEQMYLQAEKEMLEERKSIRGNNNTNRVSKRKKKDMDEEELLEIMEESSDPGEFMATLTESQRISVENAAIRKQNETKDKINARIKEMMKENGVCNLNRKVVSILKVRGLVLEIVKGFEKISPVMLTVWKVQEPTLDLLKRMNLLNVYWTTVTGARMGELHLSTSKQTTFTETKKQNYLNRFPDVQKYIKKCTPISEMNHSSFAPVFNEVDTVGLVFKIEPADMTQSNHSTNNLQMSPNMQTIYMTDENMNFIAVHFWGGVVKFGYDKTIVVGKVLACSNLQHRSRSSKKRFRNLYATEYTTFSQCPRKKYLDDSFKMLENKLKLLNLYEFMEACKTRLIEMASLSKVNSSSSSNNSYSSVKNNWTSNVVIKRKLELSENSLSGLDFDSSFNEPVSYSAGNHLQNNIISTLALDTTPSKDVERRIKKLKVCYDEPPPLSPIVFNVSKSLRKEFTTPKFDSSDSINKSITSNDSRINIEDRKKFDEDSDVKLDSDPFKENFVYQTPPDLI